MTAEFESLVLEHLRAIQADVSGIKDRLSAIEQTLDSTLSDSEHETSLGLIRRVEHINGGWN